MRAGISWLPLWLAVVSWSWSCSSPSRPPNNPGGGSGAAGSGGSGGSAASAIDAAPPAPPPGEVGDACTPDRSHFQSTCADGLVCFPGPGGAGACTAPCGVTGIGACPGTAVCLPTGRGGEFCARACQRDEECPIAGLVCDPGRHACAPPAFASPVPPVCPGAAPPAGDFSAVVALSSDKSSGVYQFEPSAAVTPSGDLVVLYTGGGRFMQPSFLGVARVPAKGAPVLDIALTTTKQMHFDPWLAADGKGVLHAVWLGHNGGGRDLDAEVGYARSIDGGATWSTPIAVHDPADCPPDTAFCLDKPMIATGRLPGKARGEAVRVFYSASAAGMRMRTSTDGGATWGGAVNVMGGTYGDVAIDGKGRIHVVASTSDEGGGDDEEERGASNVWGDHDLFIGYTVSSDGATFGKTVRVSGEDETIPFFFVNPTIAVDDRRGWIYIAYAAGTPDLAWDIQLAASKDGGKTWTRHQVNDDAHCASHMVPNLAVDPKTGSVLLTWYENRGGGSGHVAFASCKPGGATCAAATTISAPMAAYEAVRHSSKWLGEYEALVVDPKRRKLHAVWTQVVDEHGQPFARIGYASRPLK